MNELETADGGSNSLIRPNRYSAKNNVKPVNFHCTAPNAHWVALVGDFNEWRPWVNPMKREPDGSWMAQVELHHGYHHYVFLVDGKPMLDRNALGIARNARVSLIAVS